jgi:hypothetical protein
LKLVDADLYEFLRNNETGLYTKNYEKDKTVYTYVHVWHFDLSDFVKIVGSSPFDEGGLEVRMFENTIAIELNDIIENDGHELLAYRNCFDEDDWKRYEEQIQEMYK